MVAFSLWKGLVIWRCWRRYIQLTDGLTLGDNFISRSHYITEELLVHAGLNHQLDLFMSSQLKNIPYEIQETEDWKPYMGCSGVVQRHFQLLLLI